MRSFLDGDGREWDVMVGRESWGNLVLLFSPRHAGENRVAPVAVETRRQAEDELAALDDRGLRERLAASAPWQGG
ncbi:MAG TPA: hypothetical protein VFE05_02415 [Longimicrobiaceae bacterium]|nr:hypothetical protein [Longimicrobiaceae bacterium]